MTAEGATNTDLSRVFMRECCASEKVGRSGPTAVRSVRSVYIVNPQKAIHVLFYTDHQRKITSIAERQAIEFPQR